ncbi:PTS sugar transporter subunit IIC [Amedibacillus sp. YH-ame6]
MDVNKIVESKFINILQKLSNKLVSNHVFQAITSGMNCIMSLILIGAFAQIVCVALDLVFKIGTDSSIYQTIYMIYTVTMGFCGMYANFAIAYNYSKSKKLNQIQSGFVSMICFFLVCAPITQLQSADGSSVATILASNLGAGSLFVAIIIAISTVKISELVKKFNLYIKLPDAVPSGVSESFAILIPASISILIWYGIATAVNVLTAGALSLPSLITYFLSIPLQYLVSIPGICFLIVIQALCWFFGIQGAMVVWTAMLPIMIGAYATNAELHAAGQQMVFNPVILLLVSSFMGGTGNTLPLIVMSLKSKSKQLKAVSKAALIPGLFNINEPVTFGFPIMYNPLLLIPFTISPIVITLLYWLAYKFELIGIPYNLIMTCMPIGLISYVGSFDKRNVIMELLIFPVAYLIWYPFYKVYEAKLVREEALNETSISHK